MWRALLTCSMRLFVCVGGTGLSSRLLLYTAALVKVEIATECSSNVNREPKVICA